MPRCAPSSGGLQITRSSRQQVIHAPLRFETRHRSLIAGVDCRLRLAIGIASPPITADRRAAGRRPRQQAPERVAGGPQPQPQPTTHPPPTCHQPPLAALALAAPRLAARRCRCRCCRY
jgi:hypothetical protein